MSHDALDLRDETFKQTEISARYTNNRSLRLDGIELFGIESDAKLCNVLSRKYAHLGFGVRLELVNEAGNRIEHSMQSLFLPGIPSE